MQVFWDSDVGKWIEAASYALAHRRDAIIEARSTQIIDELAQRAAARRLSELLVPRPRAGKALDQPPRQPRTLQCRPPARRRHRLFPGHRQSPLLDIMQRYVDHIASVFGPDAGPEARLWRPPGNRARADQALPSHRRQEAPRPRRLFHRRARQAAAALLRRRGELPAAKTRRTSGPRPTNTTSRTSRCASRTRSSATPCARCTCTRPWPTSPPRLGDAALKRACETLWDDVTSRQMYVTAGLGPSEHNEGFTERLRPAQRHRLCRDLRIGGADLLGAAHAQSRPRRPLRRRSRTGALQRRAVRPRRATASTISTRTRWRATASTRAGTGTPVPAAR